MPLACPVTCPCRRAGEGGFLLAGAVYAALAAPLFLGADLATLIGAALDPPHPVPLPLLLWASALAGGLLLIGIALRALLTYGDGPPALSSFVVMIAAAVAFGCEWYPHTMGGRWLYGMRGVYLALIAGGAVNLGFALCARFWLIGFVAAEDGQTSYATTLRLQQQASVIANLTAERDRLTHEVDRLSALPRGNDLASFVQIVGGRRKVLAWLHPDPVKGEAEKLVATAKFQEVSALLERLGAAR